MSLSKRPIIKVELVVCDTCHRFIILSWDVLSPRGRRIPLDNLTERIRHRCLVAGAAN